MLGIDSASLSELLHVVRVVPVHKTVLALPGSGGHERLSAVRARGSSADRIGAACMRHPKLGPRNGATGKKSEFLSGGGLTVLADEMADSCLVLRSEVAELRNVLLALRADGTARR